MICASVWRIWRWNVAAETLSALVERVLDGRPSEPSDHHAWYYTRGDVDAVAQAVAERDAGIAFNYVATELRHHDERLECAELGAICDTRRAIAAAIRAAGEGE